MGTATFRRDLAAEAEKHFHGTPDERVREALARGVAALDLYVSALPPGTTRREAAEKMRLATHAGRRFSRVMDLPRE
jgi:hypothetical protein